MRLWTLGRAAGIGTVAGLAALILWPVYAAWPQALLPFAAALAIAALCGISVLAFSLIDLATQRRGPSIRPARIFDLVLGAVLTWAGTQTLLALFG